MNYMEQTNHFSHGMFTDVYLGSIMVFALTLGLLLGAILSFAVVLVALSV